MENNTKKFQTLIRSISKIVLEQQIKEYDSEISVLEENKNVLNHWMSIVFLSGSDLKIVFKIHFQSIDAKVLLQKKLKQSQIKLTQRLYFDLIKEISNLIAGLIKEILVETSSVIGISLPIITRGFDEILFISDLRETNLLRDIWKLKFKEFSLNFSSEITSLDDSVFEYLKDPNILQKSKGGIQRL